MPDRMAGSGPWAQVAVTFLAGAAAGLAVLVWIAMRCPDQAARLFDLRGDGLGAFDAFATAWVFGQAAVLLHHVLPGMVRD